VRYDWNQINDLIAHQGMLSLLPGIEATDAQSREQMLSKPRHPRACGK